MLPRMAERQHDAGLLKASVDRWLAISGMVMFPLCAAMLVSLPPAIRLLLGPAWAPAGRAALPLILLAAWSFLCFPVSVAAVAHGSPRYALRGNVASCATLLMGVLLLRPHGAVAAAEIWLGAQAIATPYTLWMNARVLRVSAWTAVRAGVPALLLASGAAALAMVLPALIGAPARPLALIAVRLSVGAGVFLAGAAVLLSRRRNGGSLGTAYVDGSVL